jgi:hypothetical protein
LPFPNGICISAACQKPGRPSTQTLKTFDILWGAAGSLDENKAIIVTYGYIFIIKHFNGEILDTRKCVILDEQEKRVAA